ncbi:AP2 domain-containing protein [Staphylococcus aureus]|uniref:AP2 domain-containing protein n=1 Tax=Staphylococcus aureus TaxID=1280 RepID=UPI001BFDF3F0|nr:AP2 domain-containing protein [Staphylococcus aureus]
MKKIFIENIDEYITIDDQDYEKVSQLKWHIVYAPVLSCRAFKDGRRVFLPSFITNKTNAYQKIKGLNFTRNNIGIDEHKYRYRKPQRNSSSMYKGVSLSEDGRYKASIYVDGKYIFLGRYESEDGAGRAYNKAVVKYWGGNGYLNDIP